MKQLSVTGNLGMGRVYEVMHPFVVKIIASLHLSKSPYSNHVRSHTEITHERP
jgi:hypothetical protein